MKSTDETRGESSRDRNSPICRRFLRYSCVHRANAQWRGRGEYVRGLLDTMFPPRSIFDAVSAASCVRGVQWFPRRESCFALRGGFGRPDRRLLHQLRALPSDVCKSPRPLETPLDWPSSTGGPTDAQEGQFRSKCARNPLYIPRTRVRIAHTRGARTRTRCARPANLPWIPLPRCCEH